MKHRYLNLILRLSILFLTIIIFIKIIDFDVLFNLTKENKIPIYICLIIVLISVLRTWLNGVRWKLLNTNVSQKLKNWDYFRYMMIANTYNLILPGVLGGDVVKVLWVRNDDKDNKETNTISILSDRVVGLCSIFILAFISFQICDIIPTNVKYISVIIFVIIIFLLFLFTYYIKHKKEKILFFLNKQSAKSKISSIIKKYALIVLQIIQYFIANPVVVLKGLLLSFIIHIMNFFANYLIAVFLDIHISFFDISMISCIIWGITILPISISGIGVRELTYIGLLGYYGVGKELATIMSLYVFAVSIVLAVVGLPFLFVKKRKSYDE